MTKKAYAILRIKSWRQQFVAIAAGKLRWLKPGMGVKRWIVVILLGTTLVGVGLAVFLLDFYRNAPDNALLPVVSTVSLNRLERPRAIGSLAGRASCLGFGIWGLTRAAAAIPAAGRTLLDTVTAYRERETRPRVVAIGGGTGYRRCCAALKAHQ